MEITIRDITDGAIASWNFKIEFSLCEIKEVKEALDILAKLPSD